MVSLTQKNNCILAKNSLMWRWEYLRDICLYVYTKKWSVTHDLYPGKCLCITFKSQRTAHVFQISSSSKAFLVIVIVMSTCELLRWGSPMFSWISLVFHRNNFCLPGEFRLIKIILCSPYRDRRNAQKPTDFNVCWISLFLLHKDCRTTP